MSDQVTQYGFTWGPMEVTRNCEYRGLRSLSVSTGTHTLQIGVSEKGHNIRAWLDHKELVVKPEPWEILRHAAEVYAEHRPQSTRAQGFMLDFADDLEGKSEADQPMAADEEEQCG